MIPPALIFVDETTGGDFSVNVFAFYIHTVAPAESLNMAQTLAPTLLRSRQAMQAASGFVFPHAAVGFCELQRPAASSIRARGLCAVSEDDGIVRQMVWTALCWGP
jgi:hypothetical protein